MRAEQRTEPLAHHGEGPVWDDHLGCLIWVDLLRGDLLSLSPTTSQVERRHVASVAACVVPRSGGGHVVATERGFLLLGPGGDDVEVLPDLWGDSDARMNDGGCDPQGRFYCGSMAYDGAEGRGVLYRLDHDRTVHRVHAPVTISNGLAWSPDGTTVYYVDSPTHRIDAFRFDPETGGFSDRRVIATVPPEAGMPDGLTVDSDGGLWVALWGGGAVRRYAADGHLDAVIELPVRQPTSCAFGGDDLTELFITTSALDLPPGGDPAAGALFSFDAGVPGLPTPRYAG